MITYEDRKQKIKVDINIIVLGTSALFANHNQNNQFFAVIVGAINCGKIYIKIQKGVRN